ncbi:hypothetical protein NJF44_10775 [Pseudomonas guariconensis]|uniref:hypothetical protein n=1 Tax=Pseudomonas TaxID=286 RepID=UPI0020985288|nr:MULTISPECIES: hypothetical protein [Pseudomonas]MCO7640771.1 hypothetical protein [Pseudomonas sp. S 311-6]MCO7515694.1 hypothetical protein [Pseudomonas putida]MCO7566465.1 hypothetical protein [Pseudomonas mosselii]MCO7605713.1 hypothetical protein [Pseudomonas guariconensis]MCO7617493.1 hypothetical protein [Pseudomonas guariconensis]
MRILIGAVGLVLLAGCATSAVPVQQADPVPRDELYAFQSKPADGGGTLTVVRDSGALGSGCDIVVYIDGKKSAKVGPGQRATFYLPPGQPNLGIGLSGSGLCGGMAVRSIAGRVEAGRESVYRISGDMNGVYIGPYINYD